LFQSTSILFGALQKVSIYASTCQYLFSLTPPPVSFSTVIYLILYDFYLPIFPPFPIPPYIVFLIYFPLFPLHPLLFNLPFLSYCYFFSFILSFSFVVWYLTTQVTTRCMRWTWLLQSPWSAVSVHVMSSCLSSANGGPSLTIAASLLLIALPLFLCLCCAWNN